MLASLQQYACCQAYSVGLAVPVGSQLERRRQGHRDFPPLVLALIPNFQNRACDHMATALFSCTAMPACALHFPFRPSPTNEILARYSQASPDFWDRPRRQTRVEKVPLVAPSNTCQSSQVSRPQLSNTFSSFFLSRRFCPCCRCIVFKERLLFPAPLPYSTTRVATKRARVIPFTSPFLMHRNHNEERLMTLREQGHVQITHLNAWSQVIHPSSSTKHQSSIVGARTPKLETSTPTVLLKHAPLHQSRSAKGP